MTANLHATISFSHLHALLQLLFHMTRYDPFCLCKFSLAAVYYSSIFHPSLAVQKVHTQKCVNKCHKVSHNLMIKMSQLNLISMDDYRCEFYVNNDRWP